MLYRYLILFVSSSVLYAFSNWIELRPSRRSANQHWTERARSLYPARSAALQNLFYIPLVVTLIVGLVWRNTSWPVVAAVAYVGAVLGAYPGEKAVHPEFTPASWLHFAGANIALRSLRWLSLAVAASLMPPHMLWTTWLVTGCYLALFFGLQVGLIFRILRWLRLLESPSASLDQLVRASAAEMHVTVRHVWVLRSVMANAMAAPITNDVLFTSRLLAVAPSDEIKAICAHEMAHLSEDRWLIATRVLSAMLWFPFIFTRPIYAAYGVGGVAALALVLFLLWLGFARLARFLEHRADKAAVSIDDNVVFARALSRIHEINLTPAVFPNRGGATHPHLYDRLVAVNMPPEYARPEPPTSLAWTTVVFSAAGMLLLVAIYTPSLK